MKAHDVHTYKLMGGDRCPFSLSLEDGTTRWVKNLGHAQFERLRKGGLKFPVEVEAVDEFHCRITDPRVNPRHFVEINW